MDIKRPAFLERIQKPADTALSKVLKGMENVNPSFVVEKLCGDADFVETFLQAIPNEEEQKKFLLHTSRYSLGAKDFDPKYVLFFRRTLPSETPKHEERWTNEYLQVRDGLKREIPEGPHRLHSIILCDSLEHLLGNGEKEGETNPFTDGEIVVNFPAYDQAQCICKFKPRVEQNELNEYLKTEGAIGLDDALKIARISRNY